MIEPMLDYIKNILVFIILITFVGIILPSNKYKEYINTVLGLILIIMTLTPINGMLDFYDFVPVFNNFTDNNYNQSLQKNLKSSLDMQIKLVLKEYDYEVIDSEFELDTGEAFVISGVYLSLYGELRDDDLKGEEEYVKKVISSFYIVPKENIHIDIQKKEGR